MPGIVVFRRRWMVASDDFVIPFGIAFVLRGLWMIVLSLAVGIFHGFYHIHQADQEEKHVCEQTLDYFMGGYLALLFATNIMELSIAWMSGKGSIMDTEPRNLIPQLLYVRLVLSIIELLWLSIGIKWIFLDSINCKLTSEVYIARAIVVFNWLFLFTVTVIIYCTFDSAGRTWVHLQRAQLTDSIDASDSYSTYIARKYEQRWEGCFRRFFCCSGAGKGNENVYTFIGRTLSEYFQDLDIVPSDFAAGLVLLRKQQKRQEQRALMAAIEEQQVQLPDSNLQKPVKKSSLRYQRTNSARTLNLKNKNELLLFKDVVYYMNYALSAYGWPIYMKNNVACGCCKLGKSFRCCYPCRRPDQRSHKFVDVESDNCCRCNFSALKRIAKLHNRDVIYVSYHNKMYETPFFVCVDHEKKAVVVTIRGTLSLQDILTDFSVEAEKIPLDDGDPNWFGHKGMIKAALYIKRKLENGILATAFNTHPEKGTDSYRLLLVGHSLGAGTAAILAILLRPAYPDLFCYAYSPPGANMSLSAANYARDFVISVVVGKDMIPRLSLFTLEDLRNKIMAVISYSTTPKWKILRGCACRCAFVCCAGCKCVNCEAQLRDSEDDWERFELPSKKNNKSPDFYPPGRVIHVVKTVSVPVRCGRKRPMFEPVWADAKDFLSIQISGLMWEDHMPDFVLEALSHCLPSKEQEESVVNAAECSCTNALEVPSSGFVVKNHVIMKRSESGSRSLSEADLVAAENTEEPQKAASIDSLALELGHPLWRTPLASTGTHIAPIARPESGFEDSELDESAASSRVSSTWKGYNLPSVQQSIDNVTIDLHPRPRANTDSASPESKRSSRAYPVTKSTTASVGSIPEKFPITRAKTLPPPKPPRTFETERSEGRASFRYKPPPKPPRTFEYDSQDQLNFSSSLYWNFPRPRAHKLQTQVSLPGNLDGSVLSTDSIEVEVSEEALPPYSPHRSRRQVVNGTTPHVAEELSSADDNDKRSLLSKAPVSRSTGVPERRKTGSRESSGPHSRFSVSDSGLNVSPEEVLLLGSVKPRAGRRRKSPLKQTTSETLHRACSSTNGADQSGAATADVSSDTNFMETML